MNCDILTMPINIICKSYREMLERMKAEGTYDPKNLPFVSKIDNDLSAIISNIGIEKTIEQHLDLLLKNAKENMFGESDNITIASLNDFFFSLEHPHDAQVIKILVPEKFSNQIDSMLDEKLMDKVKEMKDGKEIEKIYLWTADVVFADIKEDILIGIGERGDYLVHGMLIKQSTS
jgi:hypothetical protein